jgi:hypothetical protein
MWKAILLGIFCWAHAQAMTLKDQLLKGSPGDYVVTAQEKNLSLLRIDKIDPSELVLEEVVAPLAALNLEKINWPNWIQKGAPGHTAWVRYRIDLKKGELLESYSLDHKEQISFQQPLLSKMLNLELTKTALEFRRKIGPVPQAGEDDRRALWLPRIIFEDKKVSKPLCDIFEARWPDDGTDLALCRLEFYFLQGFPFPCWIEAKSAHYTFKIHSLASGKNLSSSKL